MNGQTRRRLLVTGATGGMGRVCAEQAAGQAYDLVLADLSADRLQELAARCEQQGAACECHPLDVTRAESVGDLVAALTSQPVDAIIHTVGVSPQMAGWEQIVDIDLIGSVALLEAVRPHLSPQGCVVVIASMSAHMVPPDQEIDKALAQAYESGDIEPLKGIAALANSGMAYAYAKRALKQYVADRAQAWGRENKRLVSISPGLIDTEMGRLENAAMENFEAMKSLIALDRLGRPEDIAHTALFLASPQAAYITGCDLLVDGGFVAAFNKSRSQAAGG